MELNITYDPDAEQVTVLYDNYTLITARLDSKDKVVFSKNIDQMDEEDVSRVIRRICELILSLR